MFSLAVVTLWLVHYIGLLNTFTLPPSCTPDSLEWRRMIVQALQENTTVIVPTHAPTKSPSGSPTHSPSESPSNSPSNSPYVLIPTRAPTKGPSHSPTHSPTRSPTESPTKSPSESPTKSPTVSPTRAPVNTPTVRPTNAPTHSPTQAPTNAPTKSPTRERTWQEICCSDINTEYNGYNFNGCKYDNISQAIVSLDLSYCQLTGSIDNKLSYFTSLQSLNLSHNSLDGTLPSFITDGNSVNTVFKDLTQLNLAFNNFYGTIGSNLFQYTHLKRIDLSSNSNLTLSFSYNDINLTQRDASHYFSYVNLSDITFNVKNETLFYKFFHFSNFEKLILKKLNLFSFLWQSSIVNELNYKFCVYSFDASDNRDFYGNYICNIDFNFEHCNFNSFGLSSYKGGAMVLSSNQINGSNISCYEHLHYKTLNLSQNYRIYQDGILTQCLSDYSQWSDINDYNIYCDKVVLDQQLTYCCQASFMTTASHGKHSHGSSKNDTWFDENVEWILPIIVICAIIFLAFIARLFYARKRQRRSIKGNKKQSAKMYKPTRKKSDKTEKDSLLYGDF